MQIVKKKNEKLIMERLKENELLLNCCIVGQKVVTGFIIHHFLLYSPQKRIFRDELLGQTL